MSAPHLQPASNRQHRQHHVSAGQHRVRPAPCDQTAQSGVVFGLACRRRIICTSLQQHGREREREMQNAKRETRTRARPRSTTRGVNYRTRNINRRVVRKGGVRQGFGGKGCVRHARQATAADRRVHCPCNLTTKGRSSTNAFIVYVICYSLRQQIKRLTRTLTQTPAHAPPRPAPSVRMSPTSPLTRVT